MSAFFFLQRQIVTTNRFLTYNYNQMGQSKIHQVLVLEEFFMNKCLKYLGLIETKGFGIYWPLIFNLFSVEVVFFFLKHNLYLLVNETIYYTPEKWI